MGLRDHSEYYREGSRTRKENRCQYVQSTTDGKCFSLSDDYVENLAGDSWSGVVDFTI